MLFFHPDRRRPGRRTFRPLLIAAAAVLLIEAAWVAGPLPLPAAEAKPGAAATEADQLQQATAALATGLVRNLADPDPENGVLADGLVVCTFVELKKTTRTSSLGRQLAEQMQTAFQQHRYRVVEIRQATDIVVQEKRGEFGLSRNSDRLRPSAVAAAMLTGTYTVAGDTVFINARVIDNRNGRLLSSTSATLRRTGIIDALLADPASLRDRPTEPLRVKRLEM